MHERDLWWKISIVGGLIALAFVSVYPLGQKIKYGIDLYGGYSLLYEIDDTGLSGVDRMQLSENVMKVLRKRVDPEGVFNLVWRPVGHNRLEIQMPRPPENVRDNRQRYETLQETIRGSVLRRSDILRVLAKSGEDRARSLAELVRGVESRQPLLEAAAKTYDDLVQMKAAYEARAKQIEVDNLSPADVMAAVQKGSAERPAAFAALIRGIPARQELFEAAALAWDDYQAALATSQPAATPPPTTNPADPDVKRRAFDSAVAAVLQANVDPRKLTEGATKDEVVRLDELQDERIADLLKTNLDLGRLQALLDAKPTDPFRAEELTSLGTTHPGLVGSIRGLIEVSELLKRTRKGEGRLEDPADLQRLLKGAGVLEFRILPETSGDLTLFEKYREELAARGPRPKPGEQQYQWFQLEDPLDFLKHFMKVHKKEELDRRFEEVKKGAGVVVDRFGDKYYVLSHIGDNFTLTHRTGQEWRLKGARFTRDQNGRPAIGFSLDERGGSRFAVLTRTNKGRQLAIFLDDQAISYANIKSAIRTDGIIEGSFTPQEVNDMVKKLNAGSLPQKLKDPPISVRAIGPSLGEANRSAGLKASQYGAVCVVVFMIGYYFYAGIVAVVAVALNTLFTLAIMAAMGATLTLPGIAGIVLSVGMGVDANVLINERIREELAKGTAMRMAIRLGYERAFSAILDSNVTTIITCVVLYMLGSEEIKGFGLTLGIGVFINIFTAYFITRWFFELMSMISVPRDVVKNPIILAAAVTAFGGALYALGYWWNPEVLRDRSVLMGFGRMIMWFAPALIGLLAVMWMARGIHLFFQKGGKRRIPMLHLIGSPNINWVRYRPVFFGGSIALTAICLFLFWKIDRREFYDIEFLGGTSAVIDLRAESAIAKMPDPTKRQGEISQRLAKSAENLKHLGQAAAGATITSPAVDTYLIHTPGVPTARLEPFIKAVMEKEISQEVRSAVSVDSSQPETISVRTKPEAQMTVDKMNAVPARLAARFAEAGEAIGSAQVQAVQTVGGGAEQAASFEIVTREPSKEIVVDAVVDGLGNEISIQRALAFNILPNPNAGGKPFFAVRSDDPRTLGFPLADADARETDLQGWQGSVAIVLDQIDPPQSVDGLTGRLRGMRLQPGFENYGWRESKVFGLTPPDKPPVGNGLYSRALVVVADENYPLTDEAGVAELWEQNLAEKEVALVQSALQRQTSLSQVTQFDKQVSSEAQVNAYLALVLSWLSIIVYVWFRFGSARWGMGAVVALIHDVIVAVGFVVAAHYVADTWLGRALMLEKFRMDLGMLAAFLTIIGYSVNDTIVVFDRIRENRGRLSNLTPKIINQSISQTLSRTILTVLTVQLTVLTMYLFGGQGIHGLNFAMLIGFTTGTYSSFAIASMLLMSRRDIKKAQAVA